ncbi:OTU domain-containing protein 5-A-like isoform X2 [Neocloeon triangulifer]|uniref:OTU domain-containing protein 5-A-like isoform X2 n=1 Tax=Neocloeon triangulifer TaxID=2078957 RepID=UPI00286F0194|nr:OTU domain-containing protein 5-A-like isoform X2 [Neocloeon triangulifer]
MTILAPKKSGQSSKQAQAEQEAAEQQPPHQQQQQPRSPQGNDHLGSASHRWSPGLREEAEGVVDGSRKRSMRASPHRRTKRERGAASPGSGSSASPAESTPQQEEADAASADPSGYNSGDEHTQDPNGLSETQYTEMERNFSKKLSKKGLVVREMARDGACLFRAVADQVYGDQEMHEIVRKQCMDYLERNREHFSQYVTEDFDLYVVRKREASCHGNHIELQAVSEMFNRPVQVFCYDSDPLVIWHGCSEASDDPIRLSYERGSHYNSLFDPVKGLTRKPQLPVLHQGLKDAAMVADALAHSENFAIEQAMLQDKIFASDIEATDRALEEQVARASYMEWLREAEKRQKNKMGSSSATATVTSGSCRSRCGSRSPPAGPSSSFDLFYSTPSTSWASAPGPSSADSSLPAPCTSSEATPAAQDCWPGKKKKKQKSELN